MGLLWDKIVKSTSWGGGVFSCLASRITTKFDNSFIGRSLSKHRFLRKQKRLGLVDSHKKWHAYTTTVAIFTFAFLVAFISFSLTSPTRETNAEGTNDDAASASGYTLSLSTTANVNLGLVVSAVDVMSVGQGQVNVATTSTNGYKLYIAMKNNSTSLTKSGTSDTIPGNPGTITNPTALSHNTWGYAIPKNTTHVVDNNFSTAYTTMNSTTPDNTKTFAIPPVSTESAQLIAESTTATTGTGDNIPIYYGVRANQEVTEGAYSNNVLFTAIADAGTIERVTLTPNAISANTSTTIAVTTTLYSTASSLDANIYLLTPAQYNSIVNTNVEALGISPLTCTRTSSSPMTYSCTIPATFTGEYYIYVKAPKYDKVYSTTITVNPSSFHSLTTMQQLATYPQYCMNANTPSTTAQYEDTDGTHTNDDNYVPTVTLTDTRNGEQYRIRKLADGNCWMTENLRLELTENQVLTPDDTDVAVNTTVGMTTQPYNQPETGGTGTDAYTRYNWGVADNTSTNYNRNTVDRWLSRSTKVNDEWSTETNPVQNVSADRKQDLTGENQKTGVYYNWYVATAGTGNWDISTGGVEAQSSVCPAGWELPRYSAVNDTSTLAPNGSWMYLIRDIYGIIGTSQGDQGDSGAAPLKTHAFPLSLPFSGLVSWQSGGIESQGVDGLWWSAGSASQNNARALYINSTGVWPEGNFYRLNGHTVRCVAKTFWSISEMQQMTKEIAAAATTPATDAPAPDTTGEHQGENSYVPQRTLTDIRDGETYRVRKLADGNVWMTENLRKEFTAGEVLTPATTDVATNTTVGLATQPYNQSKTGTTDGVSWDYYNWGVGTDGTQTQANTDRWLSRSTKAGSTWSTETTPVQSAAASDPTRKQDLTGEDQKTGVYYNWYTATAGTGNYDITTGSVTASSSVCPKGWEPPRFSAVNGTATLAPDGSWEHLIRDVYEVITTQGEQGSTTPSNKLHAFPFSLPSSGYVDSQSGAIYSQGENGFFWSAGSASQNFARYLYFRSTGVWPEGAGSRLYGFSVRCLAK